jgi:hypothetical protein
VDKRDLGECTQRSGIPTLTSYLISGLKRTEVTKNPNFFCIYINASSISYRALPASPPRFCVGVGFTMFSFPFLNFSPSCALRTFLPTILNFYDAQKVPQCLPAFSMTTRSPGVHPQTATSLHFPLELILSFIESASSSVGDEDRIDLLQSCSLVCRSWSTAAQKLLFAKVTLRTQRSFESFMTAVDRTTIHGRILGDAVAHLNVVLDHNQPSGLHQHSFALAVTVCPNLHELDISLYGFAEPGKDIIGNQNASRLRRTAPSFDEHTLSLLKSGPNIKALRFNNWSDNQHSYFQLLDVWSSLQFLSIGGTLPQNLQDSPPPILSRLNEVRFNFQSAPSLAFVKWLLHNSVSSLRVLRFDRDPCCDLFQYLTEIHGPQLYSISFPSLSSPDLVLSLKKCDQLRELRTETPTSSAIVYKHIPEHLEHLAFGLDRDSPLTSVIDLVKSRNALKAITVLVWDGGNQHSLLTPLKIACAYRGVDLLLTNDLKSFRI